MHLPRHASSTSITSLLEGAVTLNWPAKVLRINKNENYIIIVCIVSRITICTGIYC